MIYTWNLDPIIFSIPNTPLAVRWYGLVYGLGAILAMHWIPKLWKQAKNNPITEQKLENLVFFTFISGIIGGRLFDFIFYYPNVLFSDPISVFQLWNGGMSIHGGIIGSLLYIWFWAKKNNVPILKITDTFVRPLAFILIFGRIANFINGELWGTPTNGHWGVIFPHVDEKTRHPSPLYHAGKNFITFVLLSIAWHKKIQKISPFWQKDGILTGIFLLSYGTLRSILHIWRETTTFIGHTPVGQGLSLIMMIIGTIILVKMAEKN